MSNYYISYKQVVPWNGAVFNANEYRKAINNFYSKIDLVNPNLYLSFEIKNRRQ